MSRTFVRQLFDKVMEEEAGKLFILSFKSALERESKRVALYTEKRMLQKIDPHTAESIVITSGRKDTDTGTIYTITVYRGGEEAWEENVITVSPSGEIQQINLNELGSEEEELSRIEYLKTLDEKEIKNDNLERKEG